ncbi:MAG: hypothetical protein ABMA14_10300 [Hyphomonadaceae bacterium]
MVRSSPDTLAERPAEGGESVRAWRAGMTMQVVDAPVLGLNPMTDMTTPAGAALATAVRKAWDETPA